MFNPARSARVLRLALCAAALALGATGCREQRVAAGDWPNEKAPRASGWVKARKSRPDVVAAARFAAASLGGGGGELVSLDQASTRLGTTGIYRLRLTLEGGVRWEAVVRRRTNGAMALAGARKLLPLTEPQLRLDSGGLIITGADGAPRHIVFGTEQAGVLRAVSFRGLAEQGTAAHCGGAPTQFARWPDNLTLFFREGLFRGWSAAEPGRKLNTTDAIHVGSFSAQVRAAGADIRPGPAEEARFTVHGVHGVIAGTGVSGLVSSMWSGEVECDLG